MLAASARRSSSGSAPKAGIAVSSSRTCGLTASSELALVHSALGAGWFTADAPINQWFDENGRAPVPRYAATWAGAAPAAAGVAPAPAGVAPAEAGGGFLAEGRTF